MAPWLKFVCMAATCEPAPIEDGSVLARLVGGSAPGRQLLGEDVGELDVGLLVPVAVGVGDVVTNGVDLGLHRAYA